MSNVEKLRLAKLCVVLCVVPLLIYAHSEGPPAGNTGAPGDGTCADCHGNLNKFSGSITIQLSGGTTYTPGVLQHISVSVSDPAQKRWGFQLSARPGSNLGNGQAGDFSPTDSFTQVICPTDGPKPCPASAPIQDVEQTSAGTHNGTLGGYTFQFDWMPPSTNIGDIVFYAAGNAANGDGDLTGDHIYTTSLRISAASASPTPTINLIQDGASLQSAIAPGTWIAIKGTNLSTHGVNDPIRTWTTADFNGNNLPTSLDGTSVMVNNKPAFIWFVRSDQVNALTPADTATGSVPVTVTLNGQTSQTAMATMQSVTPGLFAQFPGTSDDGKYPVAQHFPSFSLVGKTGLYPSHPDATSPAKPGDIIIFYGNGFGATNPVVPNGQLPTQPPYNLVTMPNMTIGGIPVVPSFGGINTIAGVYQFNVTLPSPLADGDQPIVMQANGVTAKTTFITIKN